LLNIVSNAEGKAELLIWDAKAMTQEPLARVPIPAKVPYGMHSAFVADQSMQPKAAAA